MKKKLIILMLIALVAISLVACGNNGDSGNGDENNGIVKITFDINGGSGSNVEIESGMMGISDSQIPNNPTKTDFIFGGWTKTKNDINTLTDTFFPDMNNSGNYVSTRFYALWVDNGNIGAYANALIKYHNSDSKYQITVGTGANFRDFLFKSGQNAYYSFRVSGHVDFKEMWFSNGTIYERSQASETRKVGTLANLFEISNMPQSFQGLPQGAQGAPPLTVSENTIGFLGTLNGKDYHNSTIKLSSDRVPRVSEVVIGDTKFDYNIATGVSPKELPEDGLWVSDDAKSIIKYDLNGGQGTIPQPATLNMGTQYTINVSKPIRAGHFFMGWTTSRDDGTRLIGRTTFTITHDVPLFAYWLSLADLKTQLKGKVSWFYNLTTEKGLSVERKLRSTGEITDLRWKINNKNVTAYYIGSTVSSQTWVMDSREYIKAPALSLQTTNLTTVQFNTKLDSETILVDNSLNHYNAYIDVATDFEVYDDGKIITYNVVTPQITYSFTTTLDDNGRIISWRIEHSNNYAGFYYEEFKFYHSGNLITFPPLP